jgi:hypothetical protein
MQPYSELANWDGSLSDVVDSIGPSSPPETPSLAHNDLPMYDQYHKFMPNQSNQQVWISLTPFPSFESR